MGRNKKAGNRKEDISFALIDNNILEKALYVVNEKFWNVTESVVVSSGNSETIIRAEKIIPSKVKGKEAKYAIEVKNRLPDHRDAAVLFSIISTAQEQGSPEISTSIYKLLDKLGWDKSGKNYNLLRDSIDLWYSLSFEYINCFYTHDSGYISFKSRIITFYSETFDGKLQIDMQPKMFEILTKNRFFSSVVVEEYSTLKSGFQRRLYEILAKSFNDSMTFHIKWDNLRYKLEDDSKYKSTFLRKLKRAVDAINQNTTLKVSFDSVDDLIVFSLINEEKSQLIGLVNFLANYKDRFKLDDEFILRLKNKCYLKKITGKDKYLLICKDNELKEKILSGNMMSFLSLYKVDKVI